MSDNILINIFINIFSLILYKILYSEVLVIIDFKLFNIIYIFSIIIC
jgi:hypothetical protein